MYEDMASKIAKVITEYSVPIKKGDYVLISGSIVAESLVEALYEAILRRGGHPTTQLGIPGLGELLFELGSDEQIEFIDPAFQTAIEKVDVFFNLFSTSNTKSSSRVDPEKLALANKANGPLFDTYFRRIAANELRWCIMPWPTESMAQEAEMGIHAYRKFVYEACALNLDDPVAHWQNMRTTQTRLSQYLADKTHAHVKGPGIDLEFDFKDRVWVSCHGEVNFPDGEIFTGPIEDSVNGSVEFNLRTMNGGREVNGACLHFKDGKVVEASAKKGEEYLLSQLDMDEGARRLGEFAIGTNFGIQEVTGNTLFDEKIGGTIHMALGRSIPDSKGVNHSLIHWDMVHDMKNGGEIFIDGELFYQSGKFTV